VSLLRQLLAIDATGTESIVEETLQQRISLPFKQSKPRRSLPSHTQCTYLHELHQRRHEAGLSGGGIEQPHENGRGAADVLHHAGGEDLAALLRRESVRMPETAAEKVQIDEAEPGGKCAAAAGNTRLA
jgi:hypothetical protein